MRLLVLLLALPRLLPAQTDAMNPTPPSPAAVQHATLGGGCFWCVEAVYQEVPGVISVTSGYAGGHVPDPTYDQVRTGRTGHAEVVRITFDPARVSYDDILAVFWKAHDPTTPNRQGADTGPQYRSIILVENDAQRAAAEASRARAQKHIPAPIVTEIAPLTAFYPAENHHQNFYRGNPGHPYNEAVIRPKLQKLKNAAE